MGLTIHYNLSTRVRKQEKAKALVEKMRQLALDIPFEEVSDQVKHIGLKVTSLSGNELREHEDWGTICFCSESIRYPWNKNISRHINPLEMYVFTVFPGEGCESADIGLARFPKEVELDYSPFEDRKFLKNGHFNWNKWNSWLDSKNISYIADPKDPVLEERRKVKLSGGWRLGTFCKTQYASDPSCGGIPNFLRCHIGMITLLERIGELPGMKVRIEDEGHYGSSTYSEDWKEAYQAGREPTFTWHEASHDVKKLVEQVGDYNEMIAGLTGAINDSLGNEGTVVAPITNFPNFEYLEFKGSNNPNIDQFLRQMKQLIKLPTAC